MTLSPSSSSPRSDSSPVGSTQIVDTEIYEKLKASTKVKKITNEFCWFYDQPDIGMDKYSIEVGIHARLATSGLGPCFAICLQGKTENETPLIGLLHHSLGSVGESLNFLKRKAMERGCLPCSMAFYIIGGTTLDDEGRCNNISYDDENEILDLAKTESIKGVAFNIMTPQDLRGVDVVLSPEHVYYTQGRFFNSTDNDAGSYPDPMTTDDDDDDFIDPLPKTT